jgi:hypothetical protein
MDKLTLQWMFVAVWIIVVCGIAFYPMWSVHYRHIKSIRALEQYEAEREERYAEYLANMSDEERARIDEAARRLTDVVNASTISIKDIEL